MKRFDSRKIVELREKNGLTVAAFARRIGQERQNVLNWESGRNQPTVKALAIIASSFGLTVDFFFSKNNSRMKESA